MWERTNKMSYEGFAHVYDQLMAHAPYDQWISFTESILEASGKNVQKVLDLGCGTGEVALRLAEKGYDVTGVDYSTDMLSIAMAKAMDQSQSVSWINQDITSLTGFTNVDLCISYCDVMNYITSKNELEQVCRHVYDSLAADGLFLFDVHHVEYAQQKLMGHTFAEVTDELTYIWECESGDEAGEMFHYLTFFQQQANHYLRFDEVHHQITYDHTVYQAILNDCGFTKIEFYVDFIPEKQNPLNKGERIFILAQK